MEYKEALDLISDAEVFDFLGVELDETLIHFLATRDSRTSDLEIVQFSDIAIKVNRLGKRQLRHLIITNKSIYNFVPYIYSKCQREIPLHDLDAIVLSETSDEIVFKVIGDYDYHFKLVKRADLCEIIQRHHVKASDRALVFVMLGESNLYNVRTTKTGLSNESIDSSITEIRNSETNSKTVDDVEAKKKRKSFKLARGFTFRKKSQENDFSDQITMQSVSTHQKELAIALTESKEDGKDTNQASGWLCKKGSSKSSAWKRRYFILRSPNLLYFAPRTKGSTMIKSGKIRRIIRTDVNDQDLDWIVYDKDLLEKFLSFCTAHPQGVLVLFYLETLKFKSLPVTSAEHFNLAKSIKDTYILESSKEILSLTKETRGAVVQVMSDAVTEKMIPGDIFDNCIKEVLPLIRSLILPAFSKHVMESMKDEEITIDHANDKKECPACLVRFGFTHFRHKCRQCLVNFCSDCTSLGTNSKGKICDICFFNVMYSTSYLFSYALRSRSRPLYLIADSEEEMSQWIHHLREAGSLGDSKTDVKIHYEGFLIQEDPSSRTWKKRYFVLQQDRLWSHEMELKGRLIVSSMSVHPAPSQKPTLDPKEGNYAGFESKTNFSSRFILSNAQRMVHLAADDEKDVEYWAESIVKANQISSKSHSDQTYELLDQVIGRHESSSDNAPIGFVTFVFTDIQDSTKIWAICPDEMDKALAIHDRIMRVFLQRFKGYEVKTEGDAFMVAFKHPIDAVNWCLAVQKALMESPWPEGLLMQEYATKEVDQEGKMIFCGLRVRMGIHCGDCNSRRNPITKRMDYFGSSVNRCARVADSAHGGQVIVTDSVIENINESQYDASLVKVNKLGEYSYKGIDGVVPVYQISSIELYSRLFPDLRIDHTEDSTSFEPKSLKHSKSIFCTAPPSMRGRRSFEVPSLARVDG